MKRLSVAVGLAAVLASGVVSGPTPAAAQDLYAYAAATTNGRTNAAGPQPDRAWANHSSYSGWTRCSATADVIVQRPQGVTLGPTGGDAGWPPPLGLGAGMMSTWPQPATGRARAEGYFESETPFAINLPDHIYAMATSHCGSNSSNEMGIIVEDIGGLGVVLDVAVQWGCQNGTPYFNVVNNVGVWPGAAWQVNIGVETIFAQHEPIYAVYTPIGLGRVTLYSEVHATGWWAAAEAASRKSAVTWSGGLPPGDQVSGLLREAGATGTRHTFLYDYFGGDPRTGHPGFENEGEETWVGTDNSLEQNVPNPFNPATQIRFSLREGGRVAVHVFDAAGRRVKTLLDDDMPPGWHDLRWDGTDEDGRQVATGVYFCSMVANGFAQTRKMVLVK